MSSNQPSTPGRADDAGNWFRSPLRKDAGFSPCPDSLFSLPLGSPAGFAFSPNISAISSVLLSPSILSPNYQSKKAFKKRDHFGRSQPSSVDFSATHLSGAHPTISFSPIFHGQESLHFEMQPLSFDTLDLPGIFEADSPSLVSLNVERRQSDDGERKLGIERRESDGSRRSFALVGPPEKSLARSKIFSPFNSIGEHGRANERFLTPAAHDDKKAIRCKCKKSRCLKLYCDCFAILKFCDATCNCTDCHNDESASHYDIREKAIVATKERTTNAFLNKLTPENIHVAGCNCKNSHCLKKYCECFLGGALCSQTCKCKSCENFNGSETLERAREISNGSCNGKDKIRKTTPPTNINIRRDERMKVSPDSVVVSLSPLGTMTHSSSHSEQEHQGAAKKQRLNVSTPFLMAPSSSPASSSPSLSSPSSSLSTQPEPSISAAQSSSSASPASAPSLSSPSSHQFKSAKEEAARQRQLWRLKHEGNDVRVQATDTPTSDSSTTIGFDASIDALKIFPSPPSTQFNELKYAESQHQGEISVLGSTRELTMTTGVEGESSFASRDRLLDSNLETTKFEDRDQLYYPFFGDTCPEMPKITALRCLDYLDGPSIYSMSIVNALWSKVAMDDALWE